MEFKINISDPKTGKTHKKLLKDDECKPLINKKLGEDVNGATIGLPGYEFSITGGSDYCGFPMRKDVDGTMRKRILITTGVGIRNLEKGLRRRKNVAGNTIYAKTAQVNLLVTKHGKDALPENEKKAEESA
jgi:small subunit ribosomal protein S6e